MGSKPVGISGSRAAAILGLGQYEGQTEFTVWQLICEERNPAVPVAGIDPPTRLGIPRGEPGYVGFNAECGYTMPEPPDNAAIRWGTAFEDAIVELAQKGDPDCEGIVAREVFYSKDDFITCHIDGAYKKLMHTLSDISQATLHEGKTTNLWTFRELWGEPGTDRVPSGYQCQAQHQMLCTGAEECVVSVLVFPRRPDEFEDDGVNVAKIDGRWLLSFGCPKGQDVMTAKYRVGNAYPQDWAGVLAEMGLFYQYPVHAVSTLQAEMVERYRHFWATYVLPEVEPPIDCYPDMQRAFPAPVGTIVVTEQEAAWLSERKMITEEIGDTSPMARRKEELKVIALKSLRSRIKDAVLDDQSVDKLIFVDSAGKKLGQYSKGILR